MTKYFAERLKALENAYQEQITRPNKKETLGNGIYDRYLNPILTAAHAPIFWKYDLNPETNPWLMERFGINAVFNAGAIKWNGKYILMARVEGNDRKSFFAIAESDNGIDNFKFWDSPVSMPETSDPDTNVYDSRLTQHEDGWIYALFCTERRDPSAPAYDQSMAVAACGIARTKDLVNWSRLPDLVTSSAQQRNVVLHPEFDITNAVITHEDIIDSKIYHTIYEAKNGQGPTPLKTPDGWLHLAHGVRNTAAGLRYVLYVFMTDLNDLTKVTHKPGGYFIAPEGEERVGDVSNVAFCNGWIMDDDGKVFIYYASSDSRMHVATSTIEKLTDYVINTPADGLRSATSVSTIHKIIYGNGRVFK